MIRIVDASVVVKCLVPERGSGQATDVLRHPVLAPDGLVAECLNALRKKVAQGWLHRDDAAAAARWLACAGIVFEPMQPLAESILALSLRLSVPAYDCAYLALARSLDGVLITADARLLARCRQPDAADLSGHVMSLFDEPPQVQERPARPYRPRRMRA